MKSRSIFLVVFLGALWGFAAVPASKAAATGDDANPFLGRWDLTLKAPDGEHPSWLEVRQQDGQLKAQFTGRAGAMRVPSRRSRFPATTSHLYLPRTKNPARATLSFRGELKGHAIAGTLNGPDGKTWQWTGVKAPSLEKLVKTPMQWGTPIQLFNGKDLSGWHQSKPGPPDWTDKDANLVTPGNGPELINDQKFQDFQLHVEFNCGKDANSGVYLRGRYETQIETESEAEPARSHHTGGIYGFLAAHPQEQPRSLTPGRPLTSPYISRRVTVVQNGETIIDNQEIPGLTGSAPRTATRKHLDRSICKAAKKGMSPFATLPSRPRNSARP